ncbi:nitrogenase cofactor biosynthesis protein NifB [Candidatus Methylacidiphilum infernorum]|uniref:FeMo cofactor biosynthesis protein NifB n=1 Tax=Methylacidiphilum infernorum (isolate V4) TaxID=481448 RepID=B3DYY9_METI4|nr:nitrogenase cofactor biosynthesis protein NifB [Candidatus Methylacidiphilum infernorum]ACD82511.1 FeMo cofactor biosynthesis protein NifB, Radical SAM superfamily enzyme [Methylacidiphilum infernorum V4]
MTAALTEVAKPKNFQRLKTLGLSVTSLVQHQGCGSKGGSGKSSCGSGAGAGDLPEEIWEKVKNHPCYSEEAHHYYARMHVAVAPACNIQCNYCNRKYDCANESRPGVVSERLTPEEAANKVLAVASLIPQMTVLGIAGPGDPLANPDKTFKTFELVAKKAPDIKLCLSTNGLALPDYVKRIKEFNVDHVTITINMIEPEVGEKIYPWVFYKHKRYKGKEAARILSERQLEGLEMLTSEKILCKINSVMIPGINDEHLVEVNKAVKSRGAFLHNIMPLISAPEHGTYFGLTGQRGPTAQELKALQDKCEGQMNMMRHCRQCRADAVGLLGEDRSSEFTKEKLSAIELNYNLEARNAYKSQVELERQKRLAERQRQLQEVAKENSDLKILVAVATKGGGKINEHFGHAKEFQVYEVSTKGSKFIGHRRVDLYCQGGYGEDDALETVIRAIRDCVAVFVAKIGACPKEALEKAGIEPIDQFAFEYIEKAALSYFKDYLRRVSEGLVDPTKKGDALIRQGALIAQNG